MNVCNWKDVTQNRDRWMRVVEQDRTLNRLQRFIRRRRRRRGGGRITGSRFLLKPVGITKRGGNIFDIKLRSSLELPILKITEKDRLQLDSRHKNPPADNGEKAAGCPSAGRSVCQAHLTFGETEDMRGSAMKRTHSTGTVQVAGNNVFRHSRKDMPFGFCSNKRKDTGLFKYEDECAAMAE